MRKKVILVLVFVFIGGVYNRAHCQNTRTNEYNNIGWYTTFHTLKFAPRFSTHFEYQWRRDNFVTHWQQSLLRLGINFKINDAATTRIGYGWIETYPYGNTPINVFGKTFTEHRVFEALLVDNTVGKLLINHRYMLEQRWIGKFASPLSKNETEFTYLNRMRYMVRVQLPLKRNSTDGKGPYIAAYDEVFIGFGKNVGENIFDQNRIGLLAGYKWNAALRVEGGYLNQIVQLGREVSGRNVLQYNSGFIVSIYFTTNLLVPKQ